MGEIVTVPSSAPCSECGLLTWQYDAPFDRARMSSKLLASEKHYNCIWVVVAHREPRDHSGLDYQTDTIRILSTRSVFCIGYICMGVHYSTGSSACLPLQASPSVCLNDYHRDILKWHAILYNFSNKNVDISNFFFVGYCRRVNGRTTIHSSIVSSECETSNWAVLGGDSCWSPWCQRNTASPSRICCQQQAFFHSTPVVGERVQFFLVYLISRMKGRIVFETLMRDQRRWF